MAFRMVAEQIYAMLEDGRLHIVEGWDGIKKGYGSEVPKGNFQINDREDRSSGRCCSS